MQCIVGKVYGQHECEELGECERSCGRDEERTVSLARLDSMTCWRAGSDALKYRLNLRLTLVLASNEKRNAPKDEIPLKNRDLTIPRKSETCGSPATGFL